MPRSIYSDLVRPKNGANPIVGIGSYGPFFEMGWCAFNYLRVPGLLSDHLAASIESQVTWLFTFRGFGILEAGNSKYKLEPGHVFVSFRPAPAKVYKVEEGLPWVCVIISFKGEPATTLAKWITEKYGHYHPIPDHSEPVRLALDIVRKARRSGKRSRFYWSKQAYGLLLSWWAALEQNRKGDQMVLPALRSSKLVGMNAKSFKQYAEEIGYSRSHLTRKLGKLWGKSPGQALRRAKLDQAARLLSSGNLAIAEISRTVGYSSTSSFIRAFKAYNGKSPSEYRRGERGCVSFTPRRDS